MGGSVDVKSDLKKGTEFILNIRTKCKVKKMKENNNFFKSKSELNKFKDAIMQMKKKKKRRSNSVIEQFAKHRSHEFPEFIKIINK